MTKPKKEELESSYKGDAFTVIHCNGALKSFEKALARVHPANKQRRMTRNIISQIKRLSNGDKLSREHFPKEAALPRLAGQTSTEHFNALKRMPIRGYCWKSQTRPNTYFISHYIYKNYNDLSSDETKKVINNWRRIEENGDER